jgi:NAD-dependent dihydropyrimidine dehydrogenase PreA subunit
MTTRFKYLPNVVTLKYDDDKCIGCGMCTQVCPHGVFAMNDGKAVITDRDLCMECGACAMNCEYGAITVNAGVGCAAAVISSVIGGLDSPCCGPSTDASNEDSKKPACCG